MPRGIFITFEGSEGCGKTTQVQRLARRLKTAGHRVVETREPGGTAIGEEIRHLLQFSKAGHAMCAEAELLLFTASRAQLVREVIAPALAAGTTVIADRFLDSTTVYQGVARRLNPGVVRFVNAFAVGEYKPDLTFVLDLDLDTARRRLLQRPTDKPDRMEQQPAQFYRDVRDGYLRLAKREPERIRVIDAGAAVEEIETTIWSNVERLLKSERALIS